MFRENEKKLVNYPDPIFIEGTKKILNQMENSVCRIFTKDGSQGTGFFCKIPLSQDKYVEVFMTNYYVINKEYLDNENEIKISINDNKYIKSINLKNKIKYSNQEYDITIISLNKKECENIEFLELDENILNNDGEIYIGNSIYILHYPRNFVGNKVAVSYGILKKRFNDEKYNLMHYCSTEKGSSGSPILNISNNKIIGIHKQSSLVNEYNIGAFLYESIKEFIQLYTKTINSLGQQAQKPQMKAMSFQERLKLFTNPTVKGKANFIDKNKIEEIINFFGFSEYDDNYDNYTKIIRSIFNLGLISDINTIKYKNEIIAHKLFLKNHTSTSQDLIPAWHGTKLKNLESIIKYGLKYQGAKLPNGVKIPKTKYLPLQKIVSGKENWEKAIFATPCVICASTYSYEDFSSKYPYSSILVEIRIKPGSFTEHQSKELIGKVGGHDYLSVFHNEIYYRIKSDENVIIKSITFISYSFLNNILNYAFDMEMLGKNEVILKQIKDLQELNNLFSK